MGTFGIDAVLIEEVDRLDLQPLERAFDGLLDVLRAAVQAAHPSFLGDRGRETSKPNLVAMTTWPRNGRERFAHEFFVQ